MPKITITRTIKGRVARVFDVVAHIENFAKAVPHIVKVEYLSDMRRGVGTRFRETRLMHGKEGMNDLEVTEYIANDRVRIIADTAGTVWDTVFTVRPASDYVSLTMVMEARPHKFLARLLIPFTMWLVEKEVAKDMDAVKSYCEGAASP